MAANVLLYLVNSLCSLGNCRLRIPSIANGGVVSVVEGELDDVN